MPDTDQFGGVLVEDSPSRTDQFGGILVEDQPAETPAKFERRTPAVASGYPSTTRVQSEATPEETAQVGTELAALKVADAALPKRRMLPTAGEVVQSFVEAPSNLLKGTTAILNAPFQALGYKPPYETGKPIPAVAPLFEAAKKAPLAMPTVASAIQTLAPDSTAGQIAKGAREAVIDFAAGLTSPEMLATLPVAAEARAAQAVKTGFGMMMAASLPESVQQAVQVASSPTATPQEKAKAITSAGIQALVTGGIVAPEFIKRGVEIKLQKEPGTILVENAKPILPTAATEAEKVIAENAQREPTVYIRPTGEPKPAAVPVAPPEPTAEVVKAPEAPTAPAEVPTEQARVTIQPLNEFLAARGITEDSPLETQAGAMREYSAMLDDIHRKQVEGETIQVETPSVSQSGKDIRQDLRNEGVTPENVDALLSGKKTADQVVTEQLGIKRFGKGMDADTIIVMENEDGSRSIGFTPEAGPASSAPVNVGTMSHEDAIRLARDQGVERIQSILSRYKSEPVKESPGQPETPAPIEPTGARPAEKLGNQPEGGGPPVVEPTIAQVTTAKEPVKGALQDKGAGAQETAKTSTVDSSQAEAIAQKRYRQLKQSPNVYAKAIGTTSNGDHVVNLFQLQGVGRDVAWQQNVIVTKTGKILTKVQTTPAPPSAPKPVEMGKPIAKMQSEVSSVAKHEGQTPAKEVKAELVQRLEAALPGAVERSVWKASEHGYVEINIPGDGNFRIPRNIQAISEVRDAAKRLKTSAREIEGVPSTRRDTTHAGILKKDFADALTVYGTETNAYLRLKEQLDRADELGLEKAQRNRLDALVYELRRVIYTAKESAEGRVAQAEKDLRFAETELEKTQKFYGYSEKTKQYFGSSKKAQVELRQAQELVDARRTRLSELRSDLEKQIQKVIDLEEGEKTLSKPPTAPSTQAGGMAGPGGTTPSDVGTKAELAQLTDSLKSLAETRKWTSAGEAFSIGQAISKVKDGVSEAVEGLKAAGVYMRMRLEGKPVWTDFKAVIGDRHLALSESGVNARKFVQTSKKAIPGRLKQEAIADWIDMGGDDAKLTQAESETRPTYKAGYKAARELTPEEKTIAQNTKNYFEARLQDAIDAGILEDGIEDYIHRIYKTESPWKNGVLAELRSGINIGRPALAKKRVFEYDYEAEKAGLTPIKSFIKRVAAYDLSLNKAIADRQAVKAMMDIKMPDGRPMIDVAGVGIPSEQPGTGATLIKPSYRPTDEATPKNNRGDYKPFDHPALRKWKWVGKDEKGNPIFLQGDVLVHPDAIKQVKVLFERSAVRQNPVGRLALTASSVVKQTMLDLSLFHPVQITVHGWEHRSFKPVKEIDFTDPNTRGLIRGGLVVGDPRNYELFMEGLSGSSLTRYIPGLGPKLQAYNEWLFQDYIPRLKVSTGLHALERNRAKYKDLSEDQLYHLTANEMNAAFGELNYEMLGRSKTQQDMLRLALLAPDFLEARGRFAAQAATRYGNEQFTALALGAATMYLTARIINKLLSGEYHLEMGNAFSIVYNKRAYSLRTVQGDLLHLMTNPARFAFNRLNPVYGRTGFELLSGRDAFGRTRNAIQQLQDFATTMVPISLRGVVNPREQALWESFLNSIGVTEKRSSASQTIYELAQKYKADKKIVTEPGEFIYDPSKDRYHDLRQALMFGTDAAVRSEIGRGIENGLSRAQMNEHFKNYASHRFTGGSIKIEQDFRNSLTDDQKKLYDDALRERREVRDRYQRLRN